MKRRLRVVATLLIPSAAVAYILTKPAEPEAVLRTVAEALGHKEPRAAPRSLDFDREHLQVVTDKLFEQVNKLRRLNERFVALNNVNLQSHDYYYYQRYYGSNYYKSDDEEEMETAPAASTSLR